MKTLLVPDVHEEVTKLENLLKNHKDVDRRIFLGDWFDSFNPKPRHRGTARLLVKLAGDPMNEFVWGNHDFNYSMYDVPNLYCSGFKESKRTDLLQIIPKWVWSRFRMCIWSDDNWLISHAGLHISHVHPILGVTKEWLAHEEQRCNIAMAMRVTTRLMEPGKIYDGPQEFGGLLWLRWWELVPIDGLNQIVGHTHRPDVRSNNTPTSQNYCIDTGLRHVGILEDGKFTVLPA